MAHPDHHFMKVVKDALHKYADAPAFRPYIGPGHVWGKFAFRDVEHQIVASQEHWGARSRELGLEVGDVVGCWLTGQKYEDIINILGLCALGLVPQLFSAVYSLTMASELLSRSTAKALIFDAQYSSVAAQLAVPTFPTLTINEITSLNPSGSLGDLPPVNPSDPAFIGHTSGSTGGMPKILPQTHRWIDHIVRHKWHNMCMQPQYTGQTVINVFGSLAHVGSFCGFLGAAAWGACSVQPSIPNFAAAELLAMIKDCGLNTVMMYSTFLATQFKAARKDPDVLAALQSFRLILFMGTALDKDEENWAYEASNKLRLRNYFATSECAPVFMSSVGYEASDRLLRPMEGAYGVLIPHEQSEEMGGVQLYELVMPSGVPDGPHQSLYSSDGLYHTGDIFERIDENGYLYRGRSNDWIKVVPGFVDTVSVEGAVRERCADIAHEVVIVGQGRAWPVLIVEAAAHVHGGEQGREIADTIVARMQTFNVSRYAWDRVDDACRILVVNQGELPRTTEKNNVRRYATEERFKEEIDSIFAV